MNLMNASDNANNARIKCYKAWIKICTLRYNNSIDNHLVGALLYTLILHKTLKLLEYFSAGDSHKAFCWAACNRANVNACGYV
jgi:hypothetical protein